MTPRLRRECERDLDLLGQWLPLIDGRAIPVPLNDTPQGAASKRDGVDGGPEMGTGAFSQTLGWVEPGRLDAFDGHSRQVSRAVRALRALDRVEPKHAAVLWYAFVATGSATREAYDEHAVRVHIGDLTYDVQHPGGWYGRVALIFAPEEQRTEWLLMRGPGSVVCRRAAMRLVGEGKVNAALDAYAAARSASGVDTVKRLDLARLRAATAAANARADRELVALTRARETSKNKKGKRS